MAFLKKHYEKIILVIFLLVFMFTMVQLILIVKQSRNIGVGDLQFEEKSPDYPSIDPTKYVPSSIFEKESTWKKSSARKAENLLFCDLLSPYHSAPCPSCHAIIPIADFNNKKCSICGAALSPIDPGEIDREKDSDGDGISDIKETELGMAPNDPKDIDYDLDNDGFSNIFEIKKGTSIKDPKSHPPTIYRLFVESINRRKLRFHLKKIVKKGASKAKWEIHTSEWVQEKGRMDDKFRKIGGEVSIDGSVYKILDIIPKESESFDKKINSANSEDQSQIIIQTGNDAPITVNVKSDAYENKETISITDSFTAQKFRLVLNEKFSVPTPAAEDEETYSISKITNRDALQIQVSKAGTEDVFDVGAEPVHRLKPKETEVLPGVPVNPGDIPFPGVPVNPGDIPF